MWKRGFLAALTVAAVAVAGVSSCHWSPAVWFARAGRTALAAGGVSDPDPMTSNRLSSRARLEPRGACPEPRRRVTEGTNVQSRRYVVLEVVLCPLFCFPKMTSK